MAGGLGLTNGPRAGRRHDGLRASVARRIYLSIYFNLERPEDVDLLGLLYAVPRFQRGRAMKQVLRDRLSAYLQEHYPDRPALDREAVLEWIAANARARSTRNRREMASPAPHTVTPGVSTSGDPIRATGSETSRDDGPAATRTDAEAKLDRLLRSFLR